MEIALRAELNIAELNRRRQVREALLTFAALGAGIVLMASTAMLIGAW